MASNSTVNNTFFALFDGATQLQGGFVAALDGTITQVLQSVVVGDGASHAISLQFKVDGSTGTIINVATTGVNIAPYVVYRLESAS